MVQDLKAVNAEVDYLKAMQKIPRFLQLLSVTVLATFEPPAAPESTANHCASCVSSVKAKQTKITLIAEPPSLKPGRERERHRYHCGGDLRLTSPTGSQILLNIRRYLSDLRNKRAVCAGHKGPVNTFGKHRKQGFQSRETPRKLFCTGR